MSKFSRVVVLVVGVMSVFAAMAGAAGASTWHNTGDTTYTATSTGGSLSTGSGTLSCTSATAVGTAGTSNAGPTWSPAATGNATFNPCRIGGTPYVLTCSNIDDALSWLLDIVTGGATLTGAGCSAKAGGSEFCRITGSMNGTYADPRSGVPGRATTGAPSLRAVNGSAGACPLGNNVAGALSTQVFTINRSTGPLNNNLGPNIRQP